MPYPESKITNIKYYWITWFSVVGLMFLIRFSFLLNSPEDSRYSLFSTYAFLTWLPLIGLNFYNGKKLSTYLDEFHPEIFKKFYGHAFGMITIVDPIGLIKFCFSREKYDDDNLNKLKDFQKKFCIFTLIVFITYPAFFYLIV
jgi:hypothetical protein